MSAEFEVFLVATNRRDGGLPNPVKAVGREGAELFFTAEDARACWDRVTKEVGPGFGIYRASLRIEARLDLDGAQLDGRTAGEARIRALVPGIPTMKPSDVEMLRETVAASPEAACHAASGFGSFLHGLVEPTAADLDDVVTIERVLGSAGVWDVVPIEQFLALIEIGLHPDVTAAVRGAGPKNSP